MKIWAIDIDGVITANPDFFKWLTFHLKKKLNNNKVYIVTSRNPERYKETIIELEHWGIRYDELCFMPKELTRDNRTQGNWKKDTVQALNADIWFDNDFKWYERECKIDFSDLNCERIEI